MIIAAVDRGSQVLSDKPLRFGIVCRGRNLLAWQEKCVGELLAAGAALDLLIIAIEGGGIRRRLAGQTLLRCYEQGWVRRRSHSLRFAGVGSGTTQPAVLDCTVTSSAEGEVRWDRRDVDAIQAHDLDFLIAFAFDRPTGAILRAARHGVWRYSFGGTGDDALPYFHEVSSGRAACLARLERVENEGDPPSVLHEGAFATRIGQAATIDAALFGAAGFCARVCREMRRDQPTYASRAGSAVRREAPRPPTSTEVVVTVARQVARYLRSFWRRCFYLDIWSVAVVKRPVRSLLEGKGLSPVRWLPEPKGHRFIADPFALTIKGSTHLLVEEFDYLSGKGWISSVPLPTAAGGNAAVKVIDVAAHMSFPYLFEYSGEIYCVPETSEANDLLMFRALEFPRSWELVGKVLTGFPALDPVIFEHEGRWWLLCAKATAAPDTKLFAWYAETPLGQWTAHVLNPLKCDVRNTRAAGVPFRVEGVLYRPAQDCSQTYGGAVSLNRIVCLTPTEFEEVPVRQLVPDPNGPYPLGLHHLCPLGEVTIIDGLRRRFIAVGLLLAVLRRRANRIRRARLAAEAAGPKAL
jgi:hypothetical protein